LIAKPEPFRFKDCAVTILALGRSAQNLREFLDGIAGVPAQSIAHHFYESLLRPAFDDPEYRNDFALWARRHLHDDPLAERLGVIDPTEFPDLEDLRQHLLEVVEDRLSESLYVPWTAPGHEFHFLTSRMVVLDTGVVARTPAELADRLLRIPTGSVYFHFVEGRRRPPLAVDDFSAWLSSWGPAFEPSCRAIAAIDFHLWSLTEMRALLIRSMRDLPRDLREAG
jgi:hypothetical protein